MKLQNKKTGEIGNLKPYGEYERPRPFVFWR